ncbi:lymphocyte antigen 6G-like [Rana temporaria]|uniref:lymphocyte antigen 6G-like n=1 Tax=Rana temporaria TaxID=8407 RepID=UPI001AAC5E7F|nr:lymphocyte antigen 6G-like [Rana temporaria]
MQHKYFLLAVLAFLLSCQAGSALECYQCGGDCKSKTTLTCPIEGMRCLSVTVKAGNAEQKVKSCTLSPICDQDYSVPGGSVSVKPTCCDTDLCNSAFKHVMSLGTAVLLALVSLYLSQF